MRTGSKAYERWRRMWDERPAAIERISQEFGIAITPQNEAELDFIWRSGHRSTCNCIRRFRGKMLVNSLRDCSCRGEV